LADRHNALVFVDDCHSTGLVGPTGRGAEEHFGMPGRADIINSTLGKALGGAMGGYSTGPAELIQLLRQRARPYLFSNSLPPGVVGTSLKALELISNDCTPLDQLAANVAKFRQGMAKAGFKLLGNTQTHPICPILLGEAAVAQKFAEQMLQEG
jgi:7-keto-8-aminopelargonate synthetase-like enzyme